MLYHPDPDLTGFIQRLPKTETHLHIEGALPYELLRGLDPDRYPFPPSFWAFEYRYASFPEFERILLEHALAWFTSAERYHQAARRVFAGLAALNVRYVETSFHIGVIEFTGIPGPEILQAIREAAPPGLEVRVFVGMLRNNNTAAMRPVIEAVPEWRGLAGVDLHGLESLPLEPWTAEVWARVRAAGKETKAHAGEFCGPESVRQAVEELGVRRIQHGVRAVEDSALPDWLRERGVTLDVCPISNVKLGVAPSLREHPLARLMKTGVRCTVSTDDPLSFGNTLTDEYAGLALEAGFTHRELASLARNGFEVALLTEESRRRLLDEVDAVLAGSDDSAL